MPVRKAKTQSKRAPHPKRRKKRRYSKLALKNKKAYTLAYATEILAALLTDGFNTLPRYSFTDYRRDLQTIKSRIAGEGLYFIVSVLPSLSHELFNVLEGRPASFSGFKCRDGYPCFMRGVMRDAISGHTESIRLIYQISVAFKKLEGSYSKDSIVALWDEFVSCDASLVDIDWFSPERLPILERARHLCKQMFSDFDVYGQDTVPRPGPGATQTPTKSWMRYEPHVRYANVDKLFPLEEWFYPHHFTSYGPSLTQLETKHVLSIPTLPEAFSRYKGVPKTALKLRGICITENEIQYLQQAVRRALTKRIEQHPLYKRRIVLADQTVNGWLALISSKDRSKATLDLKSASDLNARELVSWIFQDNSELHNALMVLSDRFVKPPKEVGDELIRIFKFAPMGSALCFPIMSLVLMFLIRATIQLSGKKYPHFDSTQVFVYGDDIVVPSPYYQGVCESLESFGFKVNETKSFVRSHFRESCGVHAWKGVDITPVYFRKTPSKSLNTVVSLIDTESQLYGKDYHHTAAILRWHVTKQNSKLFRKNEFVPAHTNVLGWKRPIIDDYIVIPKYRCKWDSRTQQYLYKVKIISSDPSSVFLANESQAYLKWRCLTPTGDSHEIRVRDTEDGFSEPVNFYTGVRECVDQPCKDEILSLKGGWVPRSQLFVGTSATAMVA